MEPEVAQQIEIWKTTIATQQHFNGLQVRLRSFLITLFLAVLTAAAYALKEGIVIKLGVVTLPLSLLVCIFGALMIVAFYMMDWGYHQLLLGAVEYGEDIEKSLKGIFPAGGLTHAISKSSKSTKLLGMKTHSHMRLNVFYGALFVVMLIAAIGSHFASMAARVDSQTEVNRLSPATGNPSLHAIGYTDVHAFVGRKGDSSACRRFAKRCQSGTSAPNALGATVTTTIAPGSVAATVTPIPSAAPSPSSRP